MDSYLSIQSQFKTEKLNLIKKLEQEQETIVHKFNKFYLEGILQINQNKQFDKQILKNISQLNLDFLDLQMLSVQNQEYLIQSNIKIKHLQMNEYYSMVARFSKSKLFIDINWDFYGNYQKDKLNGQLFCCMDVLASQIRNWKDLGLQESIKVCIVLSHEQMLLQGIDFQFIEFLLQKGLRNIEQIRLEICNCGQCAVKYVQNITQFYLQTHFKIELFYKNSLDQLEADGLYKNTRKLVKRQNEYYWKIVNIKYQILCIKRQVIGFQYKDDILKELYCFLSNY